MQLLEGWRSICEENTWAVVHFKYSSSMNSMETLPLELHQMIWMRYMRDYVLPFILHEEVVHVSLPEILVTPGSTTFATMSRFIVSRLLQFATEDGGAVNPGFQRDPSGKTHYFTCEIMFDARCLCQDAVSLLTRGLVNCAFPHEVGCITNVRTYTRRSDGRAHWILADFCDEMSNWRKSMYTTVAFENYTGMEGCEDAIMRFVCGKHVYEHDLSPWGYQKIC